MEVAVQILLVLQLFLGVGLVAGDCGSAMGIESGKIPDSAFKAASVYSAGYEPSKGRLNQQTSYIAKTNDVGQWIQVDLGKVAKVTKIGTQGRYNIGQWVTMYIVSYSIDGGYFEFQTYESYNFPRRYIANTNYHSVVVNALDEPIIARYIRIHPVTWYGHISMRIELYGCFSGLPAPKPPSCMAGLGLENRNIPDSSITASSMYSAAYSPALGRLHYYYGWLARTSNQQQWFQVDFGDWTKVTRVSTQGRQNAAQWVTKYKLAYSYDGVFYEEYKEDSGQVKEFEGNTDQYMVVSHLLKKPIVTRYIRIIPVSWQGVIALRADFYGCKSGSDIPKIVCASPLGMENGKISDSAIVASSSYSQSWGPERGRLNEKREGSFNGGWLSQYADAYQFLQIDLGKVTKVTRIATQGRYDSGWWSKTYTLAYSLDGGKFMLYNNGQVLQGNTDHVNTEGRILDPPIIARFIKINVKTYQGYPSLRIEFYGCSQGFPTPKPPVCLEALGMQNGRIPNSAITASSEYNAASKAIYGRLHFLLRSRTNYGAWIAKTNDVFQYLQINFGDWTKVTRVAIQGRQDTDQWVTSFSLSYGYDAVFFKDYNENKAKKTFPGNNDRYTPVSHDLKIPIITRYIRIHPETWKSHISMRVELYGCREGFKPPQLECQSELGMKSGKIPDSSITATTIYSQSCAPKRARLDTMKSGSLSGAWIPKTQDMGQWIQVDLGKYTKITAIATQGRQDSAQWVKSYSISYSVGGGPFLPYNNNQVLPGNKDSNTIVGNILNPPIFARYIRIHPKEYKSYMALRFELYGCTKGFIILSPPPCQAALGMQSNKIPDSALKASTSYNVNSMGPRNGRLHFQPSSGQYGAWAVSTNNEFQYFEVNFGDWTKVTKVATQGRQNGAWWVKTYTLSYSYDGVFFEDYKEYGVVKVFTGNSDRYTVVINTLRNPVITRYLRIKPKTWNGYISLRAEFYGCTKGFEPPKLECQSELGMKSGKIPDSSITATTIYSQSSAPKRARLGTMKSGSLFGAWIPKTQDMGQWIQVDLGKYTKITAIATQGRQDSAQWVKSYSISYSVGGSPFLLYNNNQVLPGNKDSNTIVGNILNPPIFARYIRIHPKEYKSYMSLRFELYGCTKGFIILSPPPCQAALGMQSNKIPDSTLKASTSYNVNSMGPRNGRLHFQPSSGQYGAWAVSTNNEFQYFEVNFGDWTKVTKVATQGRQDGAWWVKTYTLSYSYDGVFFEDYKEDGGVKVFTGNSDRYTVVINTLRNPVITRFLRIKPKTWNGYISLRTEFYGCTKGFTPLKIKCREPLGIESGKIPSLAIVASSEVNQYYGPDRGRLRTKGEGSYGGGWAAKYNDVNQFLQFDLGKMTKVTAVATQGRSDANWMVTSYTLAYSVDGGSFTPYGEGDGQVFSGNNLDRNEAVGNIIDPPIIARFVQIRAKTWKGQISMRAEFYGCTEGFPTPTPLVCLDALGMQNRKIPNSAITASSEYSTSSKAIYGRLHFLFRSGINYGAWSAKTNDVFQYLQINFGDWTKVTRVAIQGRQDANQWVKSYSLSYGYDAAFFKYYYEDGEKKIFPGNNDRYTPVSNDLETPIITRYIRIHPETWQSHISMRAEFYGCRKGFEPPKMECQSELGMKSRKIPDRAITATTIYSQSHAPERARLDTMKSGSLSGAWIPKTQDVGQWIQVDLGKYTKITAIATQGRQDSAQWVKSYSISYSVNGGPFLPYNDNQVLTGNKDSNTIVGCILNPPIIARYIRIHPKEYKSYMALRFELYGCTEGFSIPSPPPCQIQLGMQNDELPNSALSASSEYNRYTGPENARLHFYAENDRYGAWVAHKQDHNQWLQVDFGVETVITRVATQGRQDAAQWVKEYTLRYSIDGFYFNHYQPSGHTKKFEGNQDRYTVVSHNLIPPIKARYLRIIPEEWKNYIALRAEFYGCKKMDGGYGEWSNWSICTKHCGGGTQTRSRKCNKPVPGVGGRDCDVLGPSQETQKCNIQSCGMDGGYGEWSNWSICTKHCGGGTQTRSRKCNKPVPGVGGRDCDVLGPSQETQKCNIQSCGSNWKSIGCFKMISRVLDRYFSRVGNIRAIDKRFRACVKRADEQGITLFGMDDRRCWTSDGTEQRYYKFGLSKDCKKKRGKTSGLSDSLSVYVYRKTNQGNWEKLGCFLNSGPRALPKRFDESISRVSGNDAMFDHCKSKAEDLGYKTFGVDDEACWSGDSADATYADYGKSSKCSVTTKTGNGSGTNINGDIFVYQLEK